MHHCTGVHSPRDPSEFRRGLNSASGGGTAVRLMGRMGCFLSYLFLFAVRSLLRFWSICFLSSFFLTAVASFCAPFLAAAA